MNTYYWGALVYPGANVAVWAHGYLCGEYVVGTKGYYGLLTITGDNPNTPDSEGPVEGELLYFTISGVPAIPTLISSVRFYDARTMQVDLVAPVDSFTMIFRSTDSTANEIPILTGSLIEAFIWGGTEKCGQASATAPGTFALTCHGDDPRTVGDEGALPGEQIYFQINGMSAPIMRGSGTYMPGGGTNLQIASPW